MVPPDRQPRRPEYHPGDATPGSAFEKIYGYLLSLARRRETEPCDDLFSVLLRAGRELSPGAVEEIVRWVSPVTHFARNVVRDVEISGQRIRAGERVVLWYTSANRDEAVFDAPERLDVTRSPNPHVGFGGGGPHICIGGYLAAMELRCFLESWLDRLGELEPAGEPVHTETNFINSYKRVPVRFC